MLIAICLKNGGAGSSEHICNKLTALWHRMPEGCTSSNHTSLAVHTMLVVLIIDRVQADEVRA